MTRREPTLMCSCSIRTPVRLRPVVAGAVPAWRSSPRHSSAASPRCTPHAAPCSGRGTGGSAQRGPRAPRQSRTGAFEGHRLLAEDRIGLPDDRGLEHRGVGVEDVLDLLFSWELVADPDDIRGPGRACSTRSCIPRWSASSPTPTGGCETPGLVSRCGFSATTALRPRVEVRGAQDVQLRAAGRAGGLPRPGGPLRPAPSGHARRGRHDHRHRRGQRRRYPRRPARDDRARAELAGTGRHHRLRRRRQLGLPGHRRHPPGGPGHVASRRGPCSFSAAISRRSPTCCCWRACSTRRATSAARCPCTPTGARR